MDISGKKERGARASAGAIQSLAQLLKALDLNCSGHEITLTPAEDLWKEHKIEGTYIEVEGHGVLLAVTRDQRAEAMEMFGAAVFKDKCEMYVYFRVE